MRTSLVFAMLACASTSALAASADPSLTITGVSQPKAAGPIYLRVVDSDSDADGVPDERILRIVCAGGNSGAAHRPVGQPRAAGLGSHVTFIKEWKPSTPQLMQMRPGYNLKENKSARTQTDGGGWTAIELSKADGLCAAAQGAVATKSRSNIQNN